jgi:hypothetical protein
MAMITAVVGEIYPLLALGVAGRDGAIDLEDRLGEELGWLSGPDPQPRLIDRVHQGEDIRRTAWPDRIAVGPRNAHAV